jgi:hypothetical protein
MYQPDIISPVLYVTPTSDQRPWFGYVTNVTSGHMEDDASFVDPQVRLLVFFSAKVYLKSLQAFPTLIIVQNAHA